MPQPLSGRLRRTRRLASTVATLLGLATLPAHADFSALKKLQAEGALVTAAVYDLDGRAPVDTLNPDQRLAPASVTKLAVAAAAYDAWPADKAFVTRLLAAGPVKGNKLDGDLVLQSEGDATLDHSSLWILAAQLRGTGIERIDGRLLVNPPYGPLGCDNVDRCDALERSDTAYNVPLAAIGVDYGTWCVNVLPGAVGGNADLRGCGLARLPVPIEGSIATVGAKGKASFWMQRETRDGQDVLRVGGAIPVGGDTRLYRAMSNPALGAGQTLREMLIELGIKVDARVEVVHGSLNGQGAVLAQSEGLPVRDQVNRMLRYSNNYIADLLTLNLGAARLGHPPAQLAEAAHSLADFVVSTRGETGDDRRSPTPPPALFSGSGLTPENELSAQDLIGLLASQYRNTRNFPAFYGGFVVPRQAPFAFVRQGNADWLDRVTLKTGTMNDPRSVCGVAGYLRKKNGGWMAFAVIVNGGPRQLHVPLYKAMDALRDDIQAVLAKY